MKPMNPITRICKARYGAWAESVFDTRVVLWAAEYLYERGISKPDIQLALKKLNRQRERQGVPCAHFEYGHTLF